MSYKSDKSFQVACDEYEQDGNNVFLTILSKEILNISSKIDKLYVYLMDNHFSHNVKEGLQEKAASLKDQMTEKGFIPLADFTRTAIHPEMGAFLTGSLVGEYLRKHPSQFSDCFCQEGSKCQIYVHPKKILRKLMIYGSKKISQQVDTYIDYLVENNKWDLMND